MWMLRGFPGTTGRECDRSLVLVVVAVVALTVFYYRTRVDTIAVACALRGVQSMTGPTLSFPAHNLAAFLLLGAVPFGAARLVCRLRPRSVGLGPGDWRAGLAWLAVGVPAAVGAAWLSASKPEMIAVYPLEPGLRPEALDFLRHVAGQLVYYVAWELCFRGVLLFGLEKRLGFAGANVVQTALSTIAHFGKPLPEVLAAIPAGLAFGGIARRTRSIWYVVVIHLVVGAAQDWFIVR